MPDMEQATVRRISWRLMPLLGLLYLVAYIDRQNISYAKLQMVDALGLSEAAFGLGASLFFIGYFLFEVPSNILLHRMGAHIWFTRIIASWGVVTILLAFTPSAPIFYLLRFLLGVAVRRGAVRAILEVRADNPAAQNLYLSEGFNRISRRRNYYPSSGGREDAVVLARVL